MVAVFIHVSFHHLHPILEQVLTIQLTHVSFDVDSTRKFVFGSWRSSTAWKTNIAGEDGAANEVVVFNSGGSDWVNPNVGSKMTYSPSRCLSVITGNFAIYFGVLLKAIPLMVGTIGTPSVASSRLYPWFHPSVIAVTCQRPSPAICGIFPMVLPPDGKLDAAQKEDKP